MADDTRSTGTGTGAGTGTGTRVRSGTDTGTGVSSETGQELRENLREIAAREAERDMMRNTGYEHHQTEVLDTHDAGQPRTDGPLTREERLGEREERLHEPMTTTRGAERVRMWGRNKMRRRAREAARAAAVARGEGQDKWTAVANTVNAENVNVRGLVALARSGQASVQGASAVVVSGGNTSLTGGSGVVVSGGDTEVHAAGVPIVQSSGKLQLEKSGAVLAMGRKVKVGDHGYVGIALTPKLTVKDGGRVLIGAIPAILIGAAFGATFALVTALIGGWRPDMRSASRDLRGTARSAQKTLNRQAKRLQRTPAYRQAKRTVQRVGGQTPSPTERARDWFAGIAS